MYFSFRLAESTLFKVSSKTILMTSSKRPNLSQVHKLSFHWAQLTLLSLLRKALAPGFGKDYDLFI